MHFKNQPSNDQNAVTTNLSTWLIVCLHISLGSELWECFLVSILILNTAGLAAYSERVCAQGGAPGMMGGRHSKAYKA